MSDETRLREQICLIGRSIFDRGLTSGSTGNISARLDDGSWLMTPTNASLGRLDPARLSRLDADFAHVGGDRPSKEVVMHRAFYRARPEAGAVVHLHSTMATAVACLADADAATPLPPLTPYFVMRVGERLPVVRYFRPGDPAMEPAIAEAAQGARAVLLANHGPVVSGATLTDAVYAAEELEEAARLYFLLRGVPIRLLTARQVRSLLDTSG